MKIDEACVTCIINQSVKVADAIEADPQLSKELTTSVAKMSQTFSFEHTPPEIASYVYEKMAEIAQREDLYEKQKEHSTQQARSFIPFLEEKIEHSNKKLLTATKIAVAGNVIDLAAEVEFDLTEELEKIFHTEFAINDVEKLDKELQKSQYVVVLGDNVGEHIFDYLYIQTLQKLYPHINFSYFVRGCPIINDVTIKEAKEAGFESLCNLVDSGVNTPGFAYSRATKEAQKLFDTADVVISKGMGNYESLSPSHRDKICFLLKVKCGVVANSLGKNLGDIICHLT
jgi:uncharacterized protein with ATP-grasp and redox domains